jgi:RNA polymerase sigma-70 factor (ECF subfamily)
MRAELAWSARRHSAASSGAHGADWRSAKLADVLSALVSLTAKSARKLAERAVFRRIELGPRVATTGCAEVDMRVANDTDLGASTLRQQHETPWNHAPAPAPRARDRRAFERAVLPCCASLRASALQLAKNRADADDLLQETLLRAWRFWPSYREQDSCRGWLQRILSNTFCSDCRASSRRRAQLSEYARSGGEWFAFRSEQDAGEQPHRRVTHEQLACSLSALNPEQRHILHLVDIDERSYRETALALDCPIGTVMSRLHRARAALRTQLTRGARARCP